MIVQRTAISNPLAFYLALLRFYNSLISPFSGLLDFALEKVGVERMSLTFNGESSKLYINRQPFQKFSCNETADENTGALYLYTFTI